MQQLSLHMTPSFVARSTCGQAQNVAAAAIMSHLFDGGQVPVPPGMKSSYSRASTRPTSAGTAASESPRSRQQRPLSARSTGEGRNSVCYEADFATTSWSDLQSAPSRPTSAKSQAVAANSSSARRLSTASGLEMVPARPDRPDSAGSRWPEHHSLEEQIMASPDFGRRPLEEELTEPILTPIPNSIATPLEKQVATAVGLRGRARLVPRLPRSVVSCKHGADCCWRWLARVALEQVWGSSLATLSLAESVKKMKEETLEKLSNMTEFAALQAERRDFEAEQYRAKAAEDVAAQLQEQLMECKVDSRDFRVLEREHGRVQNEATELRTLTGKLEAQLEIQQKKWHQEKEAMMQQATAEADALRSRAEGAEANALQAQAVEKDLRDRIQELQTQVRELKSELQEDRNMKLPKMKKGKKKSGPKRSASRKPSKSRSGTSPSKSRTRSKSRRHR